ncbi:MAG: PQQ-binding-like beta-propeller repeat protein, partial [Planctomycetota bacterium]
MHCRVPFRTSLTCLAVVGCALLGTLCQNTEGAETSSSPSGLEARQILDDTGVQGGLIVHLGCGDGQLTAALRADERYLVHGLDHDRSNVARARAAIRAAGLYGPASADLLTSTQLPYGDNLVNLVVAEDLGPVARDEVMRVLAPGGTAYLRESGRWVKRIKPRPETIDEWSHFLHDASGNAVGKDEEVGPPRHMKWTTGPRYNISHEMNPSISACVTAGGRIFTILDEGVIGLPDQRFPSQWKLVARDAFNGMLLWKLPMPKWGWQQWNTVGLWSAPLTLSRRLVAEGDTVYVTLGYSAPLQALDAASGKTLRTYAGTEGADEVILSDDVLVVCVRKQLMVASEPKAQPTPTTAKGKGKTQKQQKPKKLNPHEWPLDKPGAGMVMAFDPATGKPLWRLTPENIVLLSIASEGGRLCYHNEEELKCFDLRTGKPLWQFPVKAPSTGRNTGGTLAMRDGVVLFTGAEGVVAVAAETGKQLWSGPRAVGTGATNPPDLLIAQGLVWFSQAVEAKSQTSITRSGRDLQTGEVKQTVTVANLISPMHHYRCYRSKGTENFLML